MQNLSFALSVAIALAGALFLIIYLPRVIAWFGAVKPQKRIVNPGKSRFALLVPARNESRAIGDLFASLSRQDYDKGMYDIHVIINDPSDPTAEMCRTAGARVHVVRNQSCKGDALNGAVRTLLSEKEKYDAYIIIDADCALADDFLSRMNDAMASGCDVICAKKLVKNRLYGKNAGLVRGKGQNRKVSMWSDCNGVIWTLIDDMGNRFKSDKGITCMTVGTGLALRGSLMEKLGGWPYRKTLTEDIELMYDCASSGYTTYYSSYAKVYVEESPLHSVTNKRRCRWMSGVVASRRLYKQSLADNGSLKDRYYTTVLGCAYLYIGFCFAAGLFSIAAAAVSAAVSPDWYYMLIPCALGFGSVYLSFFLMTLTALFIERENMRGYGTLRLIQIALIHPVFYAEYIFIVGRAIFGKNEFRWEAIERVGASENGAEENDEQVKCS